MSKERRSDATSDRRAHRRGGRRQQDAGKPWYLRRRLWLAAASLAYLAWRRMRSLARGGDIPSICSMAG